jgi:Flp pilus assembly protein TadB
VQLVPIANKIVSSDPANGEVCSIQLYVIQFAKQKQKTETKKIRAQTKQKQKQKQKTETKKNRAKTKKETKKIRVQTKQKQKQKTETKKSFWFLFCLCSVHHKLLNMNYVDHLTCAIGAYRQ